MKTIKLQYLIIIASLILGVSCSKDEAEIRTEEESITENVGVTKNFTVWSVIEWVYTFNLTTPRQFTIVRFDDGSVTKDWSSVFSSNIDSLKANNPREWGMSIIENGNLKVDWDGDGSYSGYSTTREADQGVSDQKLLGCYETNDVYSYGFGDYASYANSSEIWCFKENGTFYRGSNSNFFTENGGASSTIVDDPNTGTYKTISLNLIIIMENLLKQFLQ